MRLRLLVPAAALAAALVAPAPAGAASYAPGSVIVRYHDDATRSDHMEVQSDTGTAFRAPVAGDVRELRIEDGESVRETLAELRADPEVDYAAPNYKIHATQAGGVGASQAPAPFIPNDPGRGAGWQELQWNFAGPFGVNAPLAWAYARQRDRDGGRGAVVAVIDSGVAYRDHGRFRRAPDLYAGRFVKPYDFIDDDHVPLDEDGHGTHVTGTIAQKTNNNLAVTGLAYGVKIMPIRVLDERGDGNSADFTRALRYAARNGADVVNMSVEYDNQLRASDIPEAITAMRYAKNKGSLLVGASGNESDEVVAYPARSGHAMAVGATTHGGCLAAYSNHGTGIDLVAPGGGEDAAPLETDWDRTHCDPSRRGRVIYQQTMWRSVRNFEIVGFEGTSEAAPHVAAIAALVIATKSAGSNPSPSAVQDRIQRTARDIGAPGFDSRYGHGLADAAAAIAP